MSACRPRQSGALQIDIVPLQKWARGIARGVRGDYGFRRGSAEEEDLEGVALVALVELANRYDELQLPAGGNLVDAFMGYADVEIRSRCRRHAVTLRNGGTFRTTSSADARRMCVEALPLTADGSDVALPWPEDAREEEPPPVACRYEPRLTVVGKPAGG